MDLASKLDALNELRTKTYKTQRAFQLQWSKSLKYAALFDATKETALEALAAHIVDNNRTLILLQLMGHDKLLELWLHTRWILQMMIFRRPTQNTSCVPAIHERFGDRRRITNSLSTKDWQSSLV